MPIFLNIKIWAQLYGKNIIITWQNWAVVFPIKKIAVVVLSITILISSGNFGIKTYAYQAKSVVPGHWLYSLRQNIELAKIEATDIEPQRINLYFDYSQKRLQEADYILRQNKNNVANLFSVYAEDINLDLTNSSIVNDLIVESNNLQSIAFKELNYIEDIELLASVSEIMLTRKKAHYQALDNFKLRLANDFDKDIFDKIYQTNTNNWQQFEAFHQNIKMAKQAGKKNITFDFKPGLVHPININESSKQKFIHKHLRKLETMSDLKGIQKLHCMPPAEMKKIHDDIKNKMEQGDWEQAQMTMKKFKTEWHKNHHNSKPPRPCFKHFLESSPLSTEK